MAMSFASSSGEGSALTPGNFFTQLGTQIHEDVLEGFDFFSGLGFQKAYLDLAKQQDRMQREKWDIEKIMRGQENLAALDRNRWVRDFRRALAGGR